MEAQEMIQSILNSIKEIMNHSTEELNHPAVLKELHDLDDRVEELASSLELDNPED